MSNTKFRIGDMVVSKERPTFGRKGVVEYIRNDNPLDRGDIFVNLGKEWAGHNGLFFHTGYRATHNNGWWFRQEELELDKESKVLEILRTWHSTRKERT